MHTAAALRPAHVHVQADRSQNAIAAVGILSVLAVAIGLVITNSANRAQEALNAQGQVTERFGKAVDQLGSDKPDVRLGAIYSLERLMKDSPPDAGPIVEVLSAYVRDHAPRHGPAPLAGPTAGVVQPTTEVQAVLTVLGRRPAAIKTAVDFTRASLAGANLIDANLRQADLDDADLSGANLMRADLTGAYMAAADLSGANLRGVRGITAEQLAGARISAATILPAGGAASSSPSALHGP